MRDDLSATQAAVLAELHRRADGGEPLPTYRELCARFRWSSTGTARDHLQALARKGYIRLSDGRARRIQLLETTNPVRRVPILGRVVAGYPVPAGESDEGSLPVPASWLKDDSHFAVRVVGDSMKEAGILEGDFVVVRKTAAPSESDLVVASVDNETTLKRYRRIRGRPFLIAENRRYSPIEIGEHATVIVHGVVVGLMRSYESQSLGLTKGK